MLDSSDEVRQVKLATAALFTCLVRSMENVDPGLQERFLKKMSEAYDYFRGADQDEVLYLLETFAWTFEMITGREDGSAPKDPFLRN